MPRSTKPRKRYRPRELELDPVEATAARAAKLPPSKRASLQRRVQLAFDAMRSAVGGWPAWNDMADAMNVAERLAQVNICSDRRAEFRAAQEALAAVHARHAATSSWTLRATELAALDMGVLLYSVQLDHCSQGELKDAIDTVARRLRMALKGNGPKDALMCVGQLGQPGAKQRATC